MTCSISAFKCLLTFLPDRNLNLLYHCAVFDRVNKNVPHGWQIASQDEFKEAESQLMEMWPSGMNIVVFKGG
jgi:hypothetical protein